MYSTFLAWGAEQPLARPLVMLCGRLIPRNCVFLRRGQVSRRGQVFSWVPLAGLDAMPLVRLGAHRSRSPSRPRIKSVRWIAKEQAGMRRAASIAGFIRMYTTDLAGWGHVASLSETRTSASTCSLRQDL